MLPPVFRRLRLPLLATNASVEYDLNLLGVPPRGQYTPEEWAAALERRDYKRFRFLSVPLPSSIFGARLIIFPDSNASIDCPIELIIIARELSALTLLHTKTHELAHAALGHPTVTINQQELAGVLKSNGKEIWEYATCRANSQIEENGLSKAKKKMLKQDVDAERLAQQILGREVRFFQQRKNARPFGEESYEEIGRLLGFD